MLSVNIIIGLLHVIDKLLQFQIQIFDPSSNIITHEWPYAINRMKTLVVLQLKIRVR